MTKHLNQSPRQSHFFDNFKKFEFLSLKVLILNMSKV